MANYIYTGNKPDHISYSQIFNGKCLYKYMRLRLLNDIDSSSLAMSLGHVVHSILNNYTDHCVKNQLQGDYDVMENAIEQEFNDGRYPEEIYKEAREICIAMGQSKLEFDKVLDYEKEMDVCIGKDKHGKDITLRVVIDLVRSYRDDSGTVLEFIDYKNQMNILTKNDVEKHEQLNLYKYAGAVHLYPGFNRVRIGVHHTRYDFIRWGDLKRVKDLSVEFDNQESFLIRQWERLINSDEYAPQRCSACWDYGQCPVMAAGECPLYTKKEVDALYVSQNIEDMITAYRKLSVDASNLKSKIRKYFESNKNINVGGKVVGFQQKVSGAYILPPWYEYCKEKEVSLDDITISKTQAEKAINKYKKITSMTEDELKRLRSMQIEKVSCQFNV